MKKIIGIEKHAGKVRKIVYFKNKLEVTCLQDEPRDIEFALVRNAAEDRPVLLNIGGVRFEVTWELLDKLPQSR